MNNCAKYHVGTVLFENIVIACYDFYDPGGSSMFGLTEDKYFRLDAGLQDDRTMGVFCKGVYDSMIKDFKSVTFQ